VDEVFLDLEDAVAPDQKGAARSAVATALRDGDWGTKVAAIRMNDVTTAWAYRDVIDVVEQAGDVLDVIVLPKVTGPDDVRWLDLLLSQVEAAMGYLQIGQQPAGYRGGDAFHYAHLRILVAARAFGLQAVDGPYAAIHDGDGLRASAASVAALGYDGKWVLHPAQVDIVNAEFSPAQDEYDRAELLLEAYEYHTGRGQGAAMLDGEMIDEASRKLALVAAARGRAAGLSRTREFQPPGG